MREKKGDKAFSVKLDILEWIGERTTYTVYRLLVTHVHMFGLSKIKLRPTLHFGLLMSLSPKVTEQKNFFDSKSIKSVSLFFDFVFVYCIVSYKSFIFSQENLKIVII